MADMPHLQTAIDKMDLTEFEKGILGQCVGRGGYLRASKPKDGCAAYVWRMLGFYLSGDRKLQCMPCTADFGIAKERYSDYPGDYDFKRRNAYIKDVLDPIVNKVIDATPKTEWHGIRRWANALGKVV